MLDPEFQDGDNALDSANYSQVQSACPKVARQLRSEFEVIEGEEWGNRGYTEAAKQGGDDATKAWQRGCEDVMTRCQRQGLVKDWTVTVERGSHGEYETLVKFFDIPASKAGARLSLAPPWAR
jgi:hypothetical protein